MHNNCICKVLKPWICLSLVVATAPVVRMKEFFEKFYGKSYNWIIRWWSPLVNVASARNVAAWVSWVRMPSGGQIELIQRKEGWGREGEGAGGGGEYHRDNEPTLCSVHCVQIVPCWHCGYAEIAPPKKSGRVFREGPVASLRGQRTSERGQGPYQLITNFC